MGLLFLRAAAAIPPIQHGVRGHLPATLSALIILELVTVVAAGLLLAGLWTPVAGVLMAAAELCLAFAHPTDPWIHILIGALGVALAMLGPGAWSIDARLFGRKRIQIPRR